MFSLKVSCRLREKVAVRGPNSVAESGAEMVNDRVEVCGRADMTVFGNKHKSFLASSGL